MHRSPGLALSFSWIALVFVLAPAALAESEEEAEPTEVITEEISAEELAERLFPDPELRTRGIRVTDEPAAPRTIGILIHFALDSSAIAEDSQPGLDEVARMLRMERLRERRLHIEGHTDATGPAEYNRRLSMRRAEAVARYLVERHGIDPARLSVSGRGPDEPLPGRDPRDALNRRVEFSAAPAPP